jgi:two-component system, sensor histidine kinase and response regulator
MDPRIIINVDDNDPARYAKGRILSLAGFAVYDAANGSEAFSLIAQHNPDLVLLDINLPDISGIEVCRRIKSAPGGGSVIVLQISATARAAPHATEALDSGADCYLAEPVDPGVLVATVKALLRLRKAERDLSAANAHLELLNRELQRSNADLEHFASAASHDLQEPLRTVSSFASLLGKRALAKLDEDEREYLQHIMEGSRRMRTLIDDLLSYSQVGRRLGSVEAVDLDKVLTSVLANLREAISGTGAEITHDPLPWVRGDEALLEHLLQNLISNAIKYARPGVTPTIHISSASENGEHIFSVRDNGIGIEDAYLHLIFSPFKRLHGREIPGTGIGLAICRRAIEAHGGRIWVQSSVGQGSNFFFSLPVEPHNLTA